MTGKRKFFMEDVPKMLQNLEAESKPQWGSMSAAQMLHHLSTGIRMSLENLNGEITTPEEKIPSYKAYLMSDKAFARELEAPAYFKQHQADEHKLANIEDLKLQLMKNLLDMLCYFDKKKDHTAVHPSFGRLNTDEWQHLHKKHIRHHFHQFGIADL